MEAALEVGHGGVFKIHVGDQLVAERSFWKFPSEAEIVAAVAKALGR